MSVKLCVSIETEAGQFTQWLAQTEIREIMPLEEQIIFNSCNYNTCISTKIYSLNTLYQITENSFQFSAMVVTREQNEHAAGKWNIYNVPLKTKQAFTYRYNHIHMYT